MRQSAPGVDNTPPSPSVGFPPSQGSSSRRKQCLKRGRCRSAETNLSMGTTSYRTLEAAFWAPWVVGSEFRSFTATPLRLAKARAKPTAVVSNIRRARGQGRSVCPVTKLPSVSRRANGQLRRHGGRADCTLFDASRRSFTPASVADESRTWHDGRQVTPAARAIPTK